MIPLLRPASKRTILDLPFAALGALDSRITFSRASTATYTDSAGVLQTAASGAARFDYDPVTHAAKGLLIEEARTNLLWPSADFSTGWASFGGTAAVTTNTATAPDGTLSADTLADTDSTAQPFFYRNVAISNDSATYTLSCFLRSGTAATTTLRLSFQGGASINADAVVTWATLTVAGVNGAAAITHVGAGWYRVSITAANNSSGNTTAQCQVRPADLLNSNTGTVYAWGAQLEAGAFPTSYIPTTSAAATRAAGVCSMALSSVPGWSATQGTVVVDVDYAHTPPQNEILFEIDSGAATNRFVCYRQPSSVLAFQADPGASAAQSAGAITTATVAACAWDATTLALSVNSAAVVTAAYTAPTGITTLWLGQNASTNRFVNSHLRRIRLYNRRLSNAQLQGLTA